MKDKAQRISGDGVFFRCSSCGFEPKMESETDDLLKMNYCPCCGSEFVKNTHDKSADDWKGINPSLAIPFGALDGMPEDAQRRHVKWMDEQFESYADQSRAEERKRIERIIMHKHSSRGIPRPDMYDMAIDDIMALLEFHDDESKNTDQ